VVLTSQNKKKKKGEYTEPKVQFQNKGHRRKWKAIKGKGVQKKDLY